MHTHVYIPVTNLVQTQVHMYKQCLPSLGISIFALSAGDLVKPAADAQSCYKHQPQQTSAPLPVHSL